MSDPSQVQVHWSAGVFLAKAKEMSRRLRVWHVDDFLSPVQFVSSREARSWVCRTFRDLIPSRVMNTERPKLTRFYPHEDGPDEQGFAGEAYYEPDRDTDRSTTQQLMGDFGGHIDAAPALPALDYLKEAFSGILDLAAWTVVEPPEPLCRKADDPRPLMVTGRFIPTDHLDVLVDAAEKLLEMCPYGWGIPADRQQQSRSGDKIKTPVETKFKELLDWGTKNLKGHQRVVVEKTIENNGEIKLADLAVLIPWGKPYDNAFNSLSRMVNRKMKAAKLPWKLRRSLTRPSSIQ